MDKILKCYFFILSELRNKQLEITYGDSSNEKLNITWNELSYIADNSLMYTNDSAYLLLNSEFFFETKLYGFDVWSANTGQINIKVNKHF